MKAAKIPKTDSIRELAKFIETHEFADFDDQMERVEGPLLADEVILKIRLNAKEVQKIKSLAKSKGVKDSELIREWIREKIKAS